MPNPPNLPSNIGGKISFMHVLVVGLSLTLTFSAWQYSKHQVETRIAQRFETAHESVVALIKDRMKKYEDALWSGASMIRSHGGDVGLSEWRAFANSMHLSTKYPGINGIGVIHFHNDQTVDAYLAEQRLLRPGFRIHPQHSQEQYMPITFIEPEGPNAAAVGLDVAHETNRRTAALASRDTGTAQITGPIVLVQDANQTPGFLFYVPFYDRGDLTTVETRQDGFRGAVYAPFVVSSLMEGLLAKDLRNVRFSIRDGSAIMYDEHAAEDADTDPDPMFAEEVTFDLYGRTWTLDVRTNLQFRERNTYVQPHFVLFAGLVVEALIISLLVLMAKANQRAISYADTVTKKLREEKSKLADVNQSLTQTNEELEQYAYIASHDLKTPIRGISGLTEMIEEDLEDYFSSDGANPDVSVNLAHIRSRVRHMENLTQGILQLSQTTLENTTGRPIKLDELVAELRSDFHLSPEQLSLETAPVSIEVDTVNFRRVLENLISNAMKYHDGTEALCISIGAEVRNNCFRISVRDNGPGIDPKYHDRIFNFFETLRIDKGQESTGIGLSIVKKAVEQHNGEIKLKSSLGEGATFTFSWPAFFVEEVRDHAA